MFHLSVLYLPLLFQGEAGLGRCGSLDSLHDLTPAERPASHVSDEGNHFSYESNGYESFIVM